MAITARPFREDQWRRIVNVNWNDAIALVHLYNSYQGSGIGLQSDDPLSEVTVERDANVDPPYPEGSGIEWAGDTGAPGPIAPDQYKQTGIYYVNMIEEPGTDVRLAPEQFGWFDYASGGYIGPADGDLSGYLAAKALWASQGPDIFGFHDYDAIDQIECSLEPPPGFELSLEFRSFFHAKYNNGAMTLPRFHHWYLINMKIAKRVAIVLGDFWRETLEYTELQEDTNICDIAPPPAGWTNIIGYTPPGGPTFFGSRMWGRATQVAVPEQETVVEVQMYSGATKFRLIGAAPNLLPEAFVEGSPVPPIPLWADTKMIHDGGESPLARFDRNGFLI